MKKRLLIGCLVALTVLIGTVSLPYHPLYQEWVCRDASLERLESLRHTLPDNPALFYYLGKRLGEARKPGEAIPFLQKAIALDPDSVRACDALATLQLSIGETRKAYDVLDKFYEAHPTNPDAFLMLGRFYLTTQYYTQALALFKDATGKFPNNAECWAMLAIARQNLLDLRGAETAATTATSLGAKESKYWFLHAQILKQMRKSNARVSYEKALQLSPKDAAVQIDYADYLVRSGNDKEGETVARQALTQKPNDPTASAALGIALAHRGESSAEPLLLQGLQKNGKDLLIIRTLQQLTAKQGKTEEAKQWLEMAVAVQARLQRESQLSIKLERNPSDVTALRQMAALAGQDGDYFRCMQYQARALKQVMDAPMPLLAAANDLKNAGFLERARRLAQQSLQNSQTPQDRQNAETFLIELNSLEQPQSR